MVDAKYGVRLSAARPMHPPVEAPKWGRHKVTTKCDPLWRPHRRKWGVSIQRGLCTEDSGGRIP
eukprot:8604548-Alexandrium_andersonii.AAC.1